MGTFFCMFKDRCNKCDCYGVYPEAMCKKCKKVLITGTGQGGTFQFYTYHFSEKGAEDAINN